MDTLLNSLLDFARVGHEGAGLEPCDLNKVVDEVLDTLGQRIVEAKIEVRIQGPLPTVTADRSRLSQVYLNLISNAIKYNDKKNKLVEIGFRKENGELIFFVRDNGLGISPEDHEAIFGIFRRLHGPTEFGGGTGAGLSITRKIIQLHGGRIWLESTPHDGSTFFFTLGAPDKHTHD
jgi:light-regulated signal transduction histidine kinase (bacteriophytochrome)